MIDTDNTTTSTSTDWLEIMEQEYTNENILVQDNHVVDSARYNKESLTASLSLEEVQPVLEVVRSKNIVKNLEITTVKNVSLKEKHIAPEVLVIHETNTAQVADNENKDNEGFTEVRNNKKKKRKVNPSLKK
ncbi:6607_t:CDS:2 [Scutellospora calospora]|uniref:6607_t:CDS:1 n=1 Tax=Scutellospora calospora TaxID=85575 RepID=A0ACA9JTX5_9GLOM|nr:6607_t:CDS:2 [Scutellospora calospora]